MHSQIISAVHSFYFSFGSASELLIGISICSLFCFFQMRYSRLLVVVGENASACSMLISSRMVRRSDLPARPTYFRKVVEVPQAGSVRFAL